MPPPGASRRALPKYNTSRLMRPIWMITDLLSLGNDKGQNSIWTVLTAARSPANQIKHCVCCQPEQVCMRYEQTGARRSGHDNLAALRRIEVVHHTQNTRSVLHPAPTKLVFTNRPMRHELMTSRRRAQRSSIRSHQLMYEQKPMTMLSTNRFGEPEQPVSLWPCRYAKRYELTALSPCF